MTTRGKIVLTILILAVAGFGGWRWWDKIAPQGRAGTPSIDTAQLKQDLAAQQAKTAAASAPAAAGKPAVDITANCWRVTRRFHWSTAPASRPSPASATTTSR